MRMINYTKAEDKILAQAAKCAKFAAAYGASTETIAKILGVQLKGDRKMKKIVKKKSVEKKSVEKYNVRGGQMEHYVGADKIHGYNHYCAFCGGYALHRFKAQRGTQVVYLCTKHMVQFFHLKPNRMAPTQKPVRVPIPEGANREFHLTRTLDAPLSFYGERTLFFDAGKIMGINYFFSIYRVIKSQEIDASLVLTVTGVGPLEKTYRDTPVAMHYVQPYYPEALQHFLTEAINFMKDPVRCHPGNATTLSVYLTDAATEFYSKWCAEKAKFEAEQAAYELGG